MIPLHDDIPSHSTPFINYAIIGICSLVFFAQLAESDNASLVEQYGMIPARVLDPSTPIESLRQLAVETPLGIQIIEERHPVADSAIAPWLTLFSCIFLHGGWMHVIGNMWFLYIFGDNIEDRLGHAGYLAFYLFCGVAASAAHLVIGPDSTIPTIGASGAIAGVMGAYFIFYPRAKVLSLVPIVFVMQMIVIPAPVFLGIWFAFQAFNGFGSSGAGGGVAWWAHIGGFAAGLATAWLLKIGNVTPPPAAPTTGQHPGEYRWKQRNT